MGMNLSNPFKRKEIEENTLQKNLESTEEKDEQEEFFVSGVIKPTTPQGTRFSPKVLIAIGTLIIAILTYVVIVGLDEPDNSKTDKEKMEDDFHKKQSTLAGNQLPDDINALPDKYSADSSNQNAKAKTAAKNQQPVIATSGQGAYQPSQRVNYPTNYPSNNTQRYSTNYPMQNISTYVSEEEKNRQAALKSPTSFNVSLGNDGMKANAREVQAALTPVTASTSTPESFLDKNRNQSSSFYTQSGLQSPRSAYEVKAGSIIPGIMISGINSDLEGQVTGQISENVYDSITGEYLLIPYGSKVIGNYDANVAYAQDRVFVAWNRIIFPNGLSISLEGMLGADTEGYSGFRDKKNDHIPRLMNGVLLGSILTAAARVATGGANDSLTYSQLVGQGVAENILQATSKITEKNLNIQPTLEIRPGYLFNIMVNKDLILQPYED